MKFKKSQTSIEVMIILGIILIVLGIIITTNMNVSDMFVSKYTKDQIRLSLKDIKSNSDLVYSQGKDATISVPITLPGGIFNSSITNNTLLFQVYSQNSYEDIYLISDYNITGTLPTEEGRYILKIKSFGGFINVSY